MHFKYITTVYVVCNIIYISLAKSLGKIYVCLFCYNLCFNVVVQKKMIKLLKIALLGTYLDRNWTSMGHAQNQVNFKKTFWRHPKWRKLLNIKLLIEEKCEMKKTLKCYIKKTLIKNFGKTTIIFPCLKRKIDKWNKWK